MSNRSNQPPSPMGLLPHEWSKLYAQWLAEQKVVKQTTINERNVKQITPKPTKPITPKPTIQSTVSSKPSYYKYIDDDFDFNGLTRQQLSKVVQKLGKIINPRYSVLGEHGGYSPAYQSLKKSGGKIKTKDKTLNQLRSEYARAKRFLTSKSSTLKGFQDVNTRLSNRLGFEQLSNTQIKSLWEAYNKLEEMKYIETKKQYGSEQIQQDVAKLIVDGSSVDDVVSKLLDKMRVEYEKQQAIDSELIGNPLDLEYLD